jgi:hypothetical protein
MNTRLVITSLAPPGAVIQLDGHAAERLAMTPRVHCPNTERLDVLVSSRHDNAGKLIAFITSGRVGPALAMPTETTVAHSSSPGKRYDAARGLLAAGPRVRTITAMTLEEIRRLLHEDAPLTIHLVSGRQFHVPHTDHAAISMNNTSLIISDDQGDIEIIRLPSIESVTLTKEPAV